MIDRQKKKRSQSQSMWEMDKKVWVQRDQERCTISGPSMKTRVWRRVLLLKGPLCKYSTGCDSDLNTEPRWQHFEQMSRCSMRSNITPGFCTQIARLTRCAALHSNQQCLSGELFCYGSRPHDKAQSKIACCLKYNSKTSLSLSRPG